MIHDLARRLSHRARHWARELGAGEEALAGNIHLSPPPPHVEADMSLPWALGLAKPLKRSPLELAKDLARSLAAADSGLAEIQDAAPAPPGFVNLVLRDSALAANLAGFLKAPAAYGRDPAADPRPLMIEFVSANPTGPLHAASGRAATLGDSLARILRRTGRKVSTEYYVNDCGRQVELLGLSMQARRDGQAPPPEGYQGRYLQDLAAALPPEAKSWKPEELARYAIEALLGTHKKDMEDFGVSFDAYFLESQLHAREALDGVLSRLKALSMTYSKEGATWLKSAGESQEEDDKDRVLVRADGRPTYFLADIAYHEDKFQRGFEDLIDIWGADHHGYVPRLSFALKALGRPEGSFRVIIHQLVRLVHGDEVVKMSKRAGEFVRLSDLLSHVGRDACRFFFAMRSPGSHLTFDVELAKKQSSENPVFYCQYVHARICSIFEEAGKRGLGAAAAAPRASAPAGGFAPEERALLAKILWFPEVLKVCGRDLSPHPLATYLLELAGLFHPFYEKHRVLDPESPERTEIRLALCAGVRDLIREGLGLLGVSAPERM